MLASILPEVWFNARPQWVLILVAVAALVAVIKGADWLVEAAAGLAERVGMPKIVVGATVVSLGTTTPEASVSVLAAVGGNSGLALGNAIGSVIADTGLIFGAGCLMVALPVDRFVLTRQGWVQFASAVAFAALAYVLYLIYGTEAEIGRWVGLVLLACLGAYLWVSVRWARAHARAERAAVADAEARRAADPEAHEPEVLLGEHGHASEHSLPILIAMGLVGLAVVIFCGDAMVGSVTELAEQWHIPQNVIAATIVALGTSLPELVVGITSIRKGHPELLVGNVVGADILNILFVIGASAVAAPLMIVDTYTTSAGVSSLSYSFLTLQLPTMLAMLVLFRIFIFSAMKRGHFSRWMGAPLLGMYVLYQVLSYTLGT